MRSWHPGAPTLLKDPISLSFLIRLLTTSPRRPGRSFATSCSSPPLEAASWAARPRAISRPGVRRRGKVVRTHCPSRQDTKERRKRGVTGRTRRLGCRVGRKGIERRPRMVQSLCPQVWKRAKGLLSQGMRAKRPKSPTIPKGQNQRPRKGAETTMTRALIRVNSHSSLQ